MDERLAQRHVTGEPDVDSKKPVDSQIVMANT
jgi:hypothetical protein